MSASGNSDSESDDEDYNPNEDEHGEDANSCSSGSEGEDFTLEAVDKNSLQKVNNKNGSVDDNTTKKTVDELWNEFLSDTNSASTSDKKTTEESVEAGKTKGEKECPVAEPSKKTVVVTEVFEFAGEEVKVTKEVDATNPAAESSIGSDQTKDVNSVHGGLKRPGGLSTVLGQLGKKQKIGTFQKSKLDWDSFKKDEQLEEELSQHNRGRGGYLDRQEFLMRSDYKQFEKERDLRLSRKKNT